MYIYYEQSIVYQFYYLLCSNFLFLPQVLIIKIEKLKKSTIVEVNKLKKS